MLELFDNAADEQAAKRRLSALAKARAERSRRARERAREDARRHRAYLAWLAREHELYGKYRAGETPRKRWAKHWATCPLTERNA